MSKSSNIGALADLAPGESGTFFARLVQRQRGLTNARRPFYTCRFRDRRRLVSTVLWEDSDYFRDCDERWEVGQCFKIQATYSVHERYGPQIEIRKIRHTEERDKVEGFDSNAFHEQSRFDPLTMLTHLRELVSNHISDEPLRKVTLGLLEQHEPILLKLPASTNRFYTFPGGWLEHVLNVTRHVVWLSDRYREHYPELQPPLNKDIIVAAAALHEIGCVLEITLPAGIDELPDFSVDGRLLGHHLLTRDLVRDALRTQGDVHPELQRLLEHVLVAYLSHPEWGSPRLPMIPEVLVLHHADDLDAKMEMFIRHLQRDPAPTQFTERDPILRQPLYKGRTV